MNWLILSLFFSVTFSFIHCDNDHLITEKPSDIREKNLQKYRTLTDDTEHCLANKSIEAESCSKYYDCLSRKTWSGGIPNMIVRAYVGSVARLPCHLCVSPFETTQVVWMYAESIQNLSFNVMGEKETAVFNEQLTLYYTRQEDEGVYRCQQGKRRGGLVLLEVTDAEKYNVVKPLSSHGPHPSPPEPLNDGLIVFTRWSRWSECSTCDKVGRRRRYGICYVALADYKRTNKTDHPDCTTNELTNDERLRLFHVYPKGIPCRSQMLPASVTTLPGVQARNNEIMIGLCKVPCKDGIFEVRSNGGGILERANNTAGIYSLCQSKPLQPPQIAREIMFVLPGAKIFVRCPGTILRDIPVTWRVGAKQVVPRQLDATTGARVHLNARDHIVFNNVVCADANVYSCWQGDILAGVVKLEISRSAEETYRHRCILVAAIIALIWLLRFMKRLSIYRLRKSFI